MADRDRKLGEALRGLDLDWSARDLQRMYGALSTRARRRGQVRRAAAGAALVTAMVAGAAAAWRARRPPAPARAVAVQVPGLRAADRGARPFRETPAAPGERTADGKKLLLFMPDVSTAADVQRLCTQASDLARIPFDGVIVPQVLRPFWHEPLTSARLEAMAAPLRCLADRGAEVFLHLQFNQQNWRDEAGAAQVLANAHLLARFLRDLPVRGLVVDTQTYVYETSVFRAGSGSPLAEQEALVRARAQAVMTALQSGGRPLDVLVTVGYTEALRRACVEGQPLAASNVALLPAFLDGLLAARDAMTGARPYVADIFLPSYPITQPAAFPMLRDLIHGRWTDAAERWVPGVQTYTFPVRADPWSGVSVWPERPRLACSEADRARVSHPMEAGFGLMLDYEHDLRGGFGRTPAEFSRNNATPEQFTEVVRAALASADRYVWVFTSTLSFLPDPGPDRAPVPEPYVEAIRAARR